MKAVALLLLCFTIAFGAQLRVSIKYGYDCTEGSELEDECDSYAAGTTTVDIVNDVAQWAFNTTDNKNLVNGTFFYVAGEMTAFLNDEVEQSAAGQHYLPPPSVGIIIQGQPGTPIASTIINRTPTSFFYYEFLVIGHISGSSVVGPLVALMGLLVVALLM